MAPSRTPQTEISPTEHLPGSTPGRAPAAPRRIPPSRTASRAAQVHGTSPILETDASQHEALRGSGADCDRRHPAGLTVLTGRDRVRGGRALLRGPARPL